MSQSNKSTDNINKNIENDIVEQKEVSKKERKTTKYFNNKLTPELITKILKDKHHNHLTVVQIKKKYDIGHNTYYNALKFSDMFVEKYGRRKFNVVSTDELNSYWENEKPIDPLPDEVREDINATKENEEKKD